MNSENEITGYTKALRMFPVVNEKSVPVPLIWEDLAAKKGADVHAYWLAVDHLMVTERDASVARVTMVTEVDKMRTDVHTKDRAVAAARLAVNVAYTKLWEAE